MRTTLEYFGQLHGTDKNHTIHNYCVKYQKYLPFSTEDNITLLELGVLGGKSLKMWRDYYRNATVIGVDVNEDCQQYDNPKQNLHVRIGDATSRTVTKALYDEFGPFDFIIDDASHMCEDQINAFLMLFEFIKSGGVYVIEDCTSSYWEQYNRNTNSMKYFKDLIDHVNFQGYYDPEKHHFARNESDAINYINKNQLPTRIDVESIHFMNGLIFIHKR